MSGVDAIGYAGAFVLVAVGIKVLSFKIEFEYTWKKKKPDAKDKP